MLLVAYVALPQLLAVVGWCAGVVLAWRLFAPGRGPFATAGGVR